MSEKTRIPLSKIAKYETGKLEPDLEKLCIIEKFYGKPADYFAEKKPPKS